ncbi:MAG: DUF1501 domain-containing protein [Alphaproteobacteria bacterium]|uniref:DUF1501 domain-containing protein n=1 Tax=Brevundimonas sp. TaxID=1871086 RepID=UPI001E1113CA|nr:DUF1501 domain-containing protein [Alphaproteobacteria bacterium]MBU1520840.1 DUF1501 domain-containing protein [Alphaproteobacteria bacterium]MBU2030122.1 DUF1501 domain-containing protein [Alphaproteobacteria bacterium]MBU2163172.1 DUF1501 domain-containing protein [Alphaproteobacteria bacterium]MBU2231351.1 DUF1501 domain-containing protein [Alphaproteobacteria bacterium]
MTRLTLDRRALLGAATAGMGLALAGRVAAQTDASRPKLVVVIARGAMDGLSVTIPYADPDYVPLRGGLALAAPGEPNGALDLAEGFGLHPALAGLHRLHDQGQMRFAPAVALPVRIRSHFEAQDVLENGGEALRQREDGWLNRAIVAAGGARLQGLSIGAQTPLILRGDAPVSSWAPGGRVTGEDRIAALLQDLYVDDPMLGQNLARGLATEALVADGSGQTVRRNDVEALGRAVARLMTGAEGADIVAVSLDGWDTHAGQRGQLQTRLTGLDQLISGLKDGLADRWSRTVVVVATEFGRTARANGTQGTDHGTGSSLLLAGGGLKPGGLIGDWPTLADNRLFEGRDLAPTLDIRSVFKGVLRDHMGLDRAALDTRVFPDSAAEAPTLAGLV